jgi:hypothetical protein
VGPSVSTLFLIPATPTDATAQACVTKVATFLTAIKASFAGGQTWTVLGNVDDIDDHTGDLQGFHAVTPATDGGSASGDPLPPANQLNLRLETGQVINGKRFRGHWYLPGFGEFGSNGAPSGAIFANVAGAAAALYGGANPLVVWHRPKGPHGSIANGQAQNVTSIGVAPKFAVLRSRRD